MRRIPQSKSTSSTLRPCVFACLLCASLLFLVLKLWRMNPWVPLDYDSDALATLAVVKAIAQHHLPFLNPNLAAPFGANWLDFPINTTVDYIVLWALTLLSRQPGLLVNLFWLGATVFTAGTAAFALLRLNARPWIATCLGAVYALQPFAFYRGITHLNLVFYVVPLLAAGAVELASGRLAAGSVPPGSRIVRHLRLVPAYVWLACLLQGFSYVYNSFFGCFVWLVAAFAAFLVRRDRRELASGFAVVAALAAFTFVNLSPSLVHVARAGENPGLMYKNAAESEVYALKLRQLFTPIPNHPFPPLHWVERSIRIVHFPGDTENASSRLGTTASLGLLFLLGSALVLCLRTSAAQAPTNGVVGACAMLALACILLATQGGFGALFNTFVANDIRAYNRIVVFVVFFALAGLAQPLSRAWDRWTAAGRSPAAAVALLLCLTVFAAYDQAGATRFLEYQDRTARYASNEALVHSIESTLGPNASVFQLPFTDFPLDFPHLQMNVYDQARPYIHSRTSGWSWGAMGERDGQWNKQTSALPAQAMVRRLCYAGFSGLWVDLGGYDPMQSPEKDLTALLGAPRLRSPDGRIAFYDLRPFQSTLAADSPAVRGSEIAAARTPLFVDYTGGFYPLEQSAAESWRWCGKQGDIRFRNGLDRPRSVTLTMMIRTADVQPHPFLATLDGRLNRFMASASGVVFHETFTVAPRAEVRLTLASEGSAVETAPSDFRTSLYFQVVDPKVVANPE